MRACTAWGAQIPPVGSNPGWEPLALSEGKGLKIQGRRGQILDAEPAALPRVGIRPRWAQQDRTPGERGRGSQGRDALTLAERQSSATEEGNRTKLTDRTNLTDLTNRITAQASQTSQTAQIS